MKPVAQVTRTSQRTPKCLTDRLPLLPSDQPVANTRRQVPPGYTIWIEGLQNMKLFAVIRTRGAAWRPSLPLEDQREWVAHARFMNNLEAKGVVVLGGPLDGTPDVLLVMRANSAEEVAKHLRDDPWTSLNVLQLVRIMPWTLRLGVLSSSQQSR